MKNKNIIIILFLVIVLLGGYIGYDKLVLDKNDNDVSEKKVLNIYGNDAGWYGETNDEGSSFKGKITCNSNDCKIIQGYDKYVIIRQQNKYYLYNYLNDNMVFGPFNYETEVDMYGSLLDYDNELIGIYYENMGEYNFYSVESNKHFPTIKGTLLTTGIDYDANTIKNYGYFVIDDGKKNNFINIKTGKIDYSIQGNFHYYYEDESNRILYLCFFDENTKTYSIYNQAGKSMYKNVSNFEFRDNKLLISYGNKFEIRDASQKLIHSSKEYDEVLGVDPDFAVVLNGGYLRMIDMEDNILATFERKWDKKKYVYHSVLSGWYTENGKNGIYLVIEDMTITYGTKGSGIEFYYIPTTKESGIIETEGVGGYAKPILYLYPTLKTNVTVNFENPSLLTTTYPKFKNNWNVTAYPNGDLYDKNGNYYYALYWEEEKNHSIDFSTGFYVENENAIDFLEEKLSIIGLTAKEKNEFIMYWLPILEKNEKNLVYFELTEERDSYNKLIITPKPDSLLRVAIHVKKVNEKVSIKEQQLTTFNRKGFTAVEWGGVNY